MKPLSQYPVSFPFGATSDPYSPSNPHKGDDHAAPLGTPIDVNGVTIGLVGSTGYSTGNHCHIGRYVNGQPTNPSGGGFIFNSAQVTEVGQDATNGKFVRVQGDGASWVYLHMSDNSKVTVGQVLQGGIMSTLVNPRLLEMLTGAYYGRAPQPTETQYFIGQPIETVMEGIEQDASGERKAYTDTVKAGNACLQNPSKVKPYSGPPLFIGA